MKFEVLLGVLVAALSLSLGGAEVPQLPAPEFADTEVSTNLAFSVSFDTMSRIEFTLSLGASPTNCVEVSIGTDANEDGCLSLDETDYTIGYRCGKWFQRDAVRDEAKDEGEVEQWNYAASSPVTHTFILKKRKLDEAWDLVKVTRRGVAEIGEVVLVEGKKPGAALIVR